MNFNNPAESDTRTRLAVEKDAAGQRLDSYLVARLAQEQGQAGVSRNRLQQALKAGVVRLAQNSQQDKPQEAQVLTPAYRLRGGETLILPATFLRPDQETQTLNSQEAQTANQVAAEALAQSLLYEDESLLVLNKPAGMVVHPAVGHGAGTLIQALATLGKTTPAHPRGGLVHRLDKGTSGVLVVARTPEAQTHLARQFANHTIERRYLALVSGIPHPPAGRIDGHLTRDKHNRQKMRLRAVATNPEIEEPPAVRGKASHSQYRLRTPLADGQAGLLELRPGTGRTHQIRVHCAAVGHPVLGDATYGGGGRRLKALRHALAPHTTTPQPTRPLLHAWRLALIHPTSQERLAFAVPPPADFCAILALLDKSQILPRGQEPLHKFLLGNESFET